MADIGNKEKIFEFFNDLIFDEEAHAYLVKGKKLKYSVSNLIKNFSKPVDFEYISYAIDANRDFPKGTTKNMWKLKGEAACARGNKAHFFGEIYAFNNKFTPDTPLEIAVKKFIDEMPKHLIPLIAEKSMYHKKYMFGGTADLLIYNTVSGKYIIADYKTNEELFKCFKDNKLSSPFENLEDTKFNKYQLQFSYYQILLEQIPEVEIEKRMLVWLKDNGTYELFPTEDFTQQLKTLLENA